MKSIAEVEEAVNKELQFGRLTHSPVVAWAFDMSRAQVEPVPVAVGTYAKFLNNGSADEFHLVPANPGFFQMAYVAQLRRAHFDKLTAEQRSEVKKKAGIFELGVWTPEDTTDWREEALMFEESTFDDLMPDPDDPTAKPSPMDEFCDALHSFAQKGSLND